MVQLRDKKGLFGLAYLVGIGVILMLLIGLMWVFFSKATPFIEFVQQYWWVIFIAFGVFMFKDLIQSIIRKFLRV